MTVMIIGYKAGLHVIHEGNMISGSLGHADRDDVGAGADHGAVAAKAGPQCQGPPEDALLGAGNLVVR